MLTAKATVQLVPLDELRPWDRNPRRIVEERFRALKRSLELEPDHLRARPLVALPDGRVIAGNMRLLAAMKLAEEHSKRFSEAFPRGRLPVFVADLDEDRATAWALRDNNEYGEWDEQQLAEMLYELEQRQADLDLTGFPQTRVTQLLDSVSGPERQHNFPDDPAPNPPAKAKTKPGQVFDLGPHRLMCGDATIPDAVARLLDGEAPALMVTDPPYGVQLDLAWRADAITDMNRKKGKATSGNRSGPAGYDRSMVNDVRIDWSAAYELVPSLKVAYVWYADKFIHDVASGLHRIGFTVVSQIIWDKLQFALSRSFYHWQHETAIYAARLAQLGLDSDVPWYGGAHVPGVFARRKAEPRMPWLGAPDQSTVWQAPSPKRRAASSAELGEEPVDHPTQKPTLLYTRPFTNHTERGDAVYEPFGGSGTAVIAAEMTGRRALVMELDPAFCDVIRERYAEYTGDDKYAP